MNLRTTPAVRAAVVAAPAPPGSPGPRWVDLVRRLESAGWSTLLVPDTLRTLSPFPALAAAANGTSSLRLRTWVVAAPLRTPGALAREVVALQVLSGGRFELGIGAGRPDAEAEAALLGASWGSAGERIEQVIRAVAAVREQVSPVPPVAVAAGGNRMLAAAAGLVTQPEDRIALAVGPLATMGELADAARRVHAVAGRQVRLSHQVSGIGEVLPAWLRHQGLDTALLRERGAAGWFPAGDHDGVAAVLIERAQALGIDEVVVPAELAEAFAPVLTRLASPHPAGAAGEAGEEERRRAAVLRAFFGADGRLSAIPAKHAKRLVVLDHLAQRFEPGERYSETEVDNRLRVAHGDVAALRRHLVDEGFLAREGGVYWRSGGSVPS
jgi:alkanesulfonate monooxygenase SsuD/methylene tetrahydromethanopterin reductase-like flavin-dependent oxidoreductase (luciferase family)